MLLENMRADKLLAFILLNISVAFCGKLFFEPLSNLDKFAKVETNEQTASDPIHWVLLVAGSNGFYNYRHQADVCHAYHIVRKHGIPEEHIVTMMYNDIANSPENPFKGKIFNKPNGTDVYEGVVIDYQGKDVTPENFLAVLRGDEKAMSNKGSGKVVKSGPNDHIFVNFVDHGGYGILGFPDSELHADDFSRTVKDMYVNKQYAQMVMYIEACESGSIIPPGYDDMNVYATTAANADESSYACYYDDKLGTYLGDVYSVSWMEDSDVEHFDLETLHKQYLIVKKETNTSHVCEFGDKKISRETLENFQGETGFHVEKKPTQRIPRKFDAVPSEDVPLASLYRRLDSSDDPQEQEELKREVRRIIKERDLIDITIKEIVHRVSAMTNHRFKDLFEANHPLTAHECYKTAVQAYKKHCFNISNSGYALRSIKKLGNMCEAHISASVISDVVSKTCKSSDDVHLYA